MSDDQPLDPGEIPEFTGDLEQLEKDVSAIGTDATSLWDAGTQIDTTFRSLSAYYEAPDADKLFATTAPVAVAGNDLCDELETIASALGAYADEVRPLKNKFERLKEEAAAFRTAVADDDDWLEDHDKVEENNHRRSEVNAAWAAFHAAERACYAKIVALIGGDPLKVNDGSNKKGMYGYRAEDLDHAEGLPWGDPVDESTPWYRLDEHAWTFFKGFVIDGVWGAVRGLGTLLAVDGWDAAGQAWTGLAKLLTGVLISALPGTNAVFWSLPDDQLPSWLRDSRTAVKETGKALVAYDEWGKNPSRAAGAVTFNVITTVFTGGSGTAAAKSGAIAKAISFAGKAGRIVDPMTYVAKGVGFGLTKVGDVMASLKGVTKGTYVQLAGDAYKITDQSLDDLPEGLTPENSVRMETPEGEVVYLNTETMVFHNADGTVRESIDNVAKEDSAADRAAVGRDASAVPDRQLVGAHVGDDGGELGRGSPTGHGDTVGGAGHARGDFGDTGRRTGDSVPGSHTTDTPPSHSGGGHGSGGGGLADVGHGDDALGDRADNATGSQSDGTGRRREVSRPSFMRDGDNPYGHSGSLGPEQIREIQVYRANHEAGYRTKYYAVDGRRLDTDVPDESGFPPPQLVKDPRSPDVWITKDDSPPPFPPKYVDGGDLTRLRDTVPTSGPLHTLDDAAHTRHTSVTADNPWHEKVSEAKRNYATEMTPENLEALDEVKAEHAPFHEAMTKDTEAYGEAIAKHHVIPEHYPGATWEELAGPKNGNDQFDQLWRREDGGFVVVEAKSSLDTRLGKRDLPSGFSATQGSKEYFLDILNEMRKRGLDGNRNEARLYRELKAALKAGKVDYILVKGRANTGEYAGYYMRRFDIG
ncbi:hypothetical protein [Streptomyces avermitilis]|uniref:hypothetical protein n=1 Tax=Streptomyces avermitilis TaxID=33903 RepID=UPI0037138F56